jgi:DNA-3-methyladenine glycosylase
LSHVTQSFYEVPAQRLARRLLGCVLVRQLGSLQLRGRIVETEAYVGVRDAGCHSFSGRRTPRNDAMYAKAGTAYVYFTYGMHYCMNVVAGKEEEPVAVLLRALEPLHDSGSAELRAMHAARGPAAKRARDLCNGPGKLCQALGIDIACNRLDLCRGEMMWIEPRATPTNARVLVGPRIGLGTMEQRWREAPLRFGLGSEEARVFLSKPFAGEHEENSSELKPKPQPRRNKNQAAASIKRSQRDHRSPPA